MEQQDFLRILPDMIFEGVSFLDRQTRITLWNKGAERMLGYPRNMVVGRMTWNEVLRHVDDQGNDMWPKDESPMDKTLEDGLVREVEAFIHHEDGHLVPVLSRICPIQDAEGSITGVAEIFVDNTMGVADRQRIEELRKMSLLDPLTGVGNRRYAELKLYSRFNEMKRYGWEFGVIFIDLDRCSDIRDKHGEKVSDEVLKLLARTLTTSIRSFDVITRWEEDRFLVVTVNIDEDRLVAISERLRQLVEQAHLVLENGILRFTVSIGATLGRGNDTLNSVVERAERLVGHSKEAGGNRVTATLG